MAAWGSGERRDAPNRSRGNAWVWLAAMLSPVGGFACNGKLPADSRKELAARSEAPLPVAAQSAAQPRAVTLEHDFGLLRPNSIAKHHFTIENASGSNWTVKRVGRTCACTVANVSSGVIKAGTSEQIEVAYRSGQGAADDRRSISVHFVEPEAPRVELVVKAAVRPPLVASTRQLQFSGVGMRFRDEQSFEIENYSGKELTSLGASVNAPWLSVREELRRSEAKFGLRCQVWRVQVRVDASGMSPGHYQGTVTVGGQGDDATLVPVSLHVRGPVDIVPERMFFGAFDGSGAAQCTVLLRANGENAKLDPADVKLNHDLGDWLALKMLNRSDALLELRGTLSLPRAVQSAKGVLTVEFNDKDHTVMTIPVFATR